MIANTGYVSSLKSMGLSAETIKPPSTSGYSLTPALSYYGAQTRVTFTESCLKQSTISCNHRPIVNIYIVYELGASGSYDSDSIWFDRKSSFSFSSGGFAQIVLTFGADMSSSTSIIRKKTY